MVGTTALAGYNRAGPSGVTPKDVDTAYDILELPRGASIQQVNKAYKRAAILHHPDKHRDPVEPENAAADFNRITEARDFLEKSGVAKLDRQFAGRKAEFEREMKELDHQFDQLEEARRKREKQAKDDAAVRQRNRDAMQMSTSDAYSKHARKRPNAVMWEGRLHGSKKLFHPRSRAGGRDEWVAEDGGNAEGGGGAPSTIVFDLSLEVWLLKLSGEDGYYVLRGHHNTECPHPHNSANKGKNVWADWCFYEEHPHEQSYIDARRGIWGRNDGRRTGLLSRGVFGPELSRYRAEEKEREEKLRRKKEEEDRRREREAEREKEEKRRKMRQRWEKYTEDRRQKGLAGQRMLTYNVGEGSKLATESVREAQVSREKKLTDQLDAKWKRGADDGELRTELARLRTALEHQVECTIDFWSAENWRLDFYDSLCRYGEITIYIVSRRGLHMTAGTSSRAE